MKPILTLLAAALLGVLPLAAAAPRVAVLHGTHSNQTGRKNLHHDEIDRPAKELGWQLTKFVADEAGFQELTASLDQYDIVYFAPLYFKVTPAVDARPYAGAFRKFVENGGALVIVDAVYAQSAAWLPELDPSLALSQAHCQAHKDPEDTEPPHPLRYLPNTPRDRNSWGHLVLPAGSSWELTVKCGDNDPAGVIRRLNKGFVYATAFRQPNVSALENLRACLELQRMGLSVAKFDMPALRVGKGAIAITLQNLTANPVDLAAGLRIAPATGEALLFDRKGTVPAAKTLELNSPYDISIRGRVRADFTLSGSGVQAILFDRSLELPKLLTVLPPRYRGFVPEAAVAKSGKIIAGIRITPYDETLTALKATVSVLDKQNRRVGKAESLDVKEANFLLPVHTGKLPAGEYTLAAELSLKGKVLTREQRPFEVVREEAGAVLIDDDMNLTVGGKPFFPIGIYHVEPADFQAVAALGFNTIQLWSWHKEGIAKAFEAGLYSIYEFNHRSNPATIAKEAAKWKNTPGLLMWYGVDEPEESQYQNALDVQSEFHKADRNHPVFMVSNQPKLYGQHADTGDILGIDNYPVPTHPLTALSDRIDLAWKATGGNKPVLFVAQSFGFESKAELAAMTYLALIHESRGLLYYPWNDGKGRDKKGIGAKYYPETQAALKELTAEIKALAPALMNGGRRQVKSADGKIHGLFCREPGGKNLLLLVNPEKKGEFRFELDSCPELRGVPRLTGLFDGKVVEAKTLTLKPYETRAFSW